MTGRAGSEFTPRAWGLLLTSVVVVSFSPVTLLTTFTLFMQPMSSDFGWSRTAAALPLTLLGVGSALMSPLIGKVVDRWGPRKVALAFTIAFGVAMILLAFLGTEGWRVYIFFGVFGLLNIGMIPCSRIIATRFERQRGMAYGLFGLGVILHTPLFLLLLRPLIDTVGWRLAYLAFGVFVLLIAVPLILLGFHEPARDGAIDHITQARGILARDAWKSRAFWMIVGSVVFSMFVAMSVATHGIAMLTERGMSRAGATMILSVIPIGGMITRPLTGYLVDRFDTPWVVMPFAIASIIGLVLFRYVDQPFALVVVAILFGLSVSGEGGTTQYWVARYFGLREFSLIYGSIQPLTWLLAISGGPLLVGALYDHTGSYDLTYILMGISLAAAAACIGLLGPYQFAADAAEPGGNGIRAKPGGPMAYVADRVS